MGEEGRRISGLSSGLAVLLNGDDNKENSNRNRLVFHCDDFGHQSVERTLERIFDIPFKSISPLSKPIDSSAVCSIIKDTFLKFHKISDGFSTDSGGVTIVNSVYGPGVVGLEESSICGDIRTIKPPLVVESFAIFSSCRFNVCVWKGKWMYEVILGTSGIQQIGWATFSCPFSDYMGVGDSDDSYAFDGRRVTKWNKDSESYGQSWVVGDAIGCCIDLDHSEISFYRNGISLGVAFNGVPNMEPGLGYYPAISLSQGERCELNFGAHPFRYPVEGFLALQDPPSVYPLCKQLLQCWSRFFEMQRIEKTEITSVDKLRRFRRFMPLDEIFQPVSYGICRELLAAINSESGSAQYLGWGSILSFMLEVYGAQSPHDYTSLDRVVDVLLEFPGSFVIFEHVFDALSSSCKTAPLVLTECPYSGSYPYLAVACHILRREELMLLWWRSSHFDFLFEGFLSRKSPNKHDLQLMIPSVYWPGSSEDVSSENSMMLTTTALARAINKIEEKHRELCRLVMQFRPPVMPQYPGSAFRSFLRNVLFKNRGADRNLPPPGVSSNSVLVSLYTVILYFLSEGFCSWMKGCGSRAGSDVGFLHRGGQQSFPLRLFLQDDPHRVDISRLGGSFSHLSKSHPVNDLEEEVIRWDEGCMDDEENKVTHSSWQKPCCCSTFDVDLARISKVPIRFSSKSSRGHCSSTPERSTHVAAECSAGSLNDEITNKPSSSDRSESDYGYRSVHHVRTVPREGNVSTETLLEEELLDAMLLLYQLGLTPNFKQASYYMSHQTQSLSLLEETDRNIRERGCGEQLKHLKEARNMYREEVSDCVRHCAWYRISLFSKWKQRGMYATCMWIAHLLLVLSKRDSVFPYIPEFYLESLVDCFHVLRKSDPPFVPSAIFIKQGLGPFVTFIVTHFNDSRISSADVRDLLVQSISVLVQYREFLAAFETNEAATERMPKALLMAFDNRSWIPVTNILLRLCKGSGFGSSKHGESSSSSIVFQTLLREACVSDEQMFSNFLNRLFNTLSWTMTEFSVSVREMQEKYQVLEFQQRKCSVIFDLSCNLARVLEFCTHEIPQAFLVGTDTNLRRLAELIVFILNHITSVADAEFLDLSLRRNGQNPEKVNRGMILAPLVGIMLNLLDGRIDREGSIQNDVVRVFASMDCLDMFYCGFQYLLEYNWAGSFRTDSDLWKLRHLEKFQSLLISQTEVQQTGTGCRGETDSQDTMCCICYACEANAQFAPCSHRSCFGCITRHLLNCQRCFFCNTTVLEVFRMDDR